MIGTIDDSQDVFQTSLILGQLLTSMNFLEQQNCLITMKILG